MKLCREYGISEATYYKWKYLEAAIWASSPGECILSGTPFVKVFVAPIYAATFKAPRSFSGFSQTLSGGFQPLIP